LSATTFSPEGRVFQVEYATKAVDNATTCIGIRTKNGIVLAAEKPKHSKLLVPGTYKHIGSIDLHAGIAATGLQPDGRQLLHRAQEEAKSYRGLLDQPIPGKVLAERLGLFMQVYTLYSSVRPFGSSIFLAVNDPYQGPQLYMIEPSGQCWGYHACTAGKGKQLARSELEKLDLSSMDVTEAVHHAARIIYLVHDESKDKDFELEMSWISPQSGGRHELMPKELVSEAEKYAKSCLEDVMVD